MPTIRLATDDDLRSITSQQLEKYDDLPCLYIPTAEPDVMRSYVVARSDGDGSVQIYERLFPGSVVAPRYVGDRVSRDDLLYHGAEPAADFCSG